MDKVELKFLRITYSHTHAGAYALILTEAQGDRRLPIIIDGVEAQAIAIQVENIKPARQPFRIAFFEAFNLEASIAHQRDGLEDKYASRVRSTIAGIMEQCL